MAMLWRIVVFLVLGVGLAWYAQRNIGYVMLVVGGWRVETTFAFFAVMLASLGMLAYWLLVGIKRVLRLHAGMRKWLQSSASSRGHKNLLSGLTLLVTGRYAEAEKKLSSRVDSSDAPLLNYLGAALAAQRVGRIAERDNYLKQAHVSVKGADAAVHLLQAQMQMEQGQFELAYATLSRLYDDGLVYDHVLDLLVRCCHELGEWERLRQLAPVLSKQSIYTQEKIDGLLVRANKNLIQSFEQQKNTDGLHQFWDSLARAEKQQTEVVLRYCMALHALGEDNEAERYVRELIQKRHESAVIELYGELKTDFQDKQLATVEEWLKHRPQDASLLLTAGKLAQRLCLWGKAKNYLETCADISPNLEAFRHLATMAEQLDEVEEANRWYRKAALA